MAAHYAVGIGLAKALSAMMTWRIQQLDAVRKWAVLSLFLGVWLSSSSSLASPPPVITVHPLSQSVLKHDSVTFVVEASSSTIMTYQWLKDGAKIPGATASTCTITKVQQYYCGNYSVRVTNAGGSVTSSNATLTILSPPVITTQPQDQMAALGQSVSFSVVAEGDAPLRYQWIRNGTPLHGDTNSVITLNPVQASDAGNYTVIVANNIGLVVSAAATLTVTDPPGALSVLGCPAMTPAGFSFQLSPPLGSTYVVQASSNNRDWTSIATNVALTASVVFTDAAAADHGSRFYRVMVP